MADAAAAENPISAEVSVAENSSHPLCRCGRQLFPREGLESPPGQLTPEEYDAALTAIRMGILLA